MAKNFSTSDAKKIVKIHTSRLNELKLVGEYKNKFIEKANSSIDKLANDKLMYILKEVPIEELSKEIPSLRVKTLHNAGYNTVLDIYKSNRYTLSSIYGISQSRAIELINASRNFATRAYNELTLNIDFEKKTYNETELIKAIYAYRSSIGLISSCNELVKDNQLELTTNLISIKTGTNIVKWLFAFKKKKEEVTKAYSNLVSLYKGEYFNVGTDLLNKLKSLDKVDPSVAREDFKKNSTNYYSIMEKISPGFFKNNDTYYGLPEELAKEVNDECFFPDGLRCELRGYQMLGVKYILHQEKVLLGDEMGLGKTIQAIATMVSLRNTGAKHFVVICPLSVLENWHREIIKHSLLSVVRVHGANKARAFKYWLASGGVALTTYETTGTFKIPEGFEINLTVVDEAHYIKNKSARRTINTLAICEKSNRLLFMSGTPLENKVDEMISLIDDLKPELTRSIQSIAFMSSSEEFRRKIAPVYYRRKRDDVLNELPEISESKEWCTLSKEEEALYERAVLSKNYMASRRLSWNVDDLSKSSKATRLLEIVNEAESDDRKVVIFSFFLETLNKIYDFLGSRCAEPINGSVSPSRRQEIIDEFTYNEKLTVLPCQIMSGGTGLNIQAASIVIICEPQLKPSTENQAVSRAYRMGQVRNVLVYRLLSPDTIDEKITKLLEEKQLEFDTFADKSVAAKEIAELDNTTFGDIIKEEIDRINKKNGVSTQDSSQA